MSREEGIPDLARKTIISHNGTQRTGIIMTKGLNLEDKTMTEVEDVTMIGKTISKVNLLVVEIIALIHLRNK